MVHFFGKNKIGIMLGWSPLANQAFYSPGVMKPNPLSEKNCGRKVVWKEERRQKTGPVALRVESERTHHAGDGWKRQAKKNDRRRLKADKQTKRKTLQSMRPMPTTSSRLCKQYHLRTKQHTCWRLLLCDAQRGFRSFGTPFANASGLNCEAVACRYISPTPLIPYLNLSRERHDNFVLVYRNQGRTSK